MRNTVGSTPGACKIDDGHCVDLGPGLVHGWVRASEDAPPPDPKGLLGCWQPDDEAIVRTNTLPHGVLAETFPTFVQGIGFRIDDSSVTEWLDLPDQGRVFAFRFPAKVTLQAPDRLYVDLDFPRELDVGALGDERMPVPRIDKHPSTILLRRAGDGRLRSDENFLLRAVFSIDAGPLELRSIPCPADLPDAPPQSD